LADSLNPLVRAGPYSTKLQQPCRQQAITALSTMIVSWLEDGGYQKLAAHDKQM
jgi:hypothetical protein